MMSSGLMRAQSMWRSELFAFSSNVVVHNEEGTIPSGLKSLEYNLSKSASGEKMWHHLHNFPNQGLSFRLKSFDSPKSIGYSFSVIPYLEFIFFKNQNFNIEVRHGTGLALFTRHFKKDSNENNVFISTHLNAETFLNAGISYPISERLRLKVGGEFSHMSNGRLSLPNKGLNMLSVYVGVKYNHTKTTTKWPEKINYQPNRRWYVIPSLHLGMSARKIESFDWQTEKEVSLSLAFQTSGRFRSLLDMGILGSNDYQGRKRQYIGFTEEVLIGQLSTKYTLGWYLDDLGSKTFSRIGLAYYPFSKGSVVASGFFIGSSLKSHGFVAQNVEVNAGYVF